MNAQRDGLTAMLSVQLSVQMHLLNEFCFNGTLRTLVDANSFRRFQNRVTSGLSQGVRYLGYAGSTTKLHLAHQKCRTNTLRTSSGSKPFCPSTAPSNWRKRHILSRRPTLRLTPVMPTDCLLLTSTNWLECVPDSLAADMGSLALFACCAVALQVSGIDGRCIVQNADKHGRQAAIMLFQHRACSIDAVHCSTQCCFHFKLA